MLELCEVCGDDLQTLQRREETKGEFIRIIIYKKCQVCGLGRIDYHPFMPIHSFEEVFMSNFKAVGGPCIRQCDVDKQTLVCRSCGLSYQITDVLNERSDNK